MAIKTLKYTVTVDGVSPNYERMAGVQYDHKKTELRFTLDSDLYDSILSQLGENKAVYRFDCYDGENKLRTGDIKELNSMILEPYELEYWVTRFGGKLKVLLVITITNDEETVKEWSYEVVLHLENLPETETSDEGYQSVATLALKIEDIAKQVQEKHKTVSDMYKKLTELEAMLEESEWIFDGDKGADIDVNFVVDSQFDEESTNALENRVVTKSFRALENTVINTMKNAYQDVYNSVTQEFKNDILSKAHPVGSYYWSDNATSPVDLFGGMWERVENVFVLAAGSEFGAGTAGGEKMHTLTESEMPKHYHMFKPNAKCDGINFVVPTETMGDGASTIAKSGANGPGHWANDTWGTYNKGGSMAHNNMPPYITAYCWKRIG